MSGGSKQQTTTMNSAPWADAQPYLKSAMTQAQNLGNQGVGGQVYTGSTVIPWSGETTKAMGLLSGYANDNSGANGLSGQSQSIINNGGLNADQVAARDATKAIASSSFNINEDPAFQQVLDQTMNSVNSNASAAGRYGSGTHQGVLAQEVGDLGARQYQNWLARKDAANSNLFSMGQQGQNNLPSAWANLQLPAQTLMQVGSMNEDLATRQKNDELRIFDAQQNKPWELLAKQNAIYSGNGALGGTSTTAQPGQNSFLTALGYGASGLGLLGSFL